MYQIPFAWFPFKLAGFSQAETASFIWGGARMIESVCGLRYAASGNPLLVLSGYPSNSWAARTWYTRVEFSTIRKAPAEFWIMADAHERLHTWGYTGAPALGHSKDPESIMHPNGSIYRWFSPGDVRMLIGRYGRPARPPQGYPPVKIEREKFFAAHRDWNAADQKWKHFAGLRNAEVAKPNTSRERLDELNKETAAWLAKRTEAGQRRSKANSKANQLEKAFDSIFHPTANALTIGEPEAVYSEGCTGCAFDPDSTAAGDSNEGFIIPVESV